MRILIAGGGTGGHIYPAIAIARAFQEKQKNALVEFVGTPAGLESKLIPQAGYKLHYIEAGRFNQVSLFNKIKTLLILPVAMLKSFVLLKKVKPDFVLGVGGFVSLPVVLTAALLGYRSYIWEPNAFPGLANRLLARFVTRCFVVFKDAAQFLKNSNCTQAHMPIRKEIEAGAPHTYVPGAFRILIFGGSQGARAINNAIVKFVKAKQNELAGFEIIHQTGSADFERIKSEYASIGIESVNLQVCEYIHDMPAKYAWADLVICRAGTGTISELAACGKAAILIPLPTAADDHQTKNAMALVNIGGAKLLAQTDLSTDALMGEIVALKDHPDERKAMEKQIQKFHTPHAAQQIVESIMNEVMT